MPAALVASAHSPSFLWLSLGDRSKISRRQQVQPSEFLARSCGTGVSMATGKKTLSCHINKKRLNLSESKPSTSTCACALDWKEWEALFPNIWFQGICGFAWFEFCSPSPPFFSSFQALNKNFKHLNVCKWNVQTFNPAKESLAINENCFGAFESSPSFHAFSIVSKSLTASFSATSGDGGQVFFSREKIFAAPQLYKRLEWNNGLMAMVGIDLLGVHLVSHWIHVRPSQLYHPKKQQKTS